MSVLPGNLEFIAMGKTGFVYALGEDRVVKVFPENDGEVERRAYERLGSHPNIAKYLGITECGSIILERGIILESVLQDACRHNKPISIHTKLQWSMDAAKGINHIHEMGILHADVGCHNMILNKDSVQIIDFEACSIDGEKSVPSYAWCSYRPSSPALSKQTEIFAFGCTVYEIMVGRPPWYELETEENRCDLVEQLYAQNRFPDVANLPLGLLIQDCWQGVFTSMSEIIEALQILIKSESEPEMETTMTRTLITAFKQTVLRLFKSISIFILGFRNRILEYWKISWIEQVLV